MYKEVINESCSDNFRTIDRRGRHFDHRRWSLVKNLAFDLTEENIKKNKKLAFKRDAFTKNFHEHEEQKALHNKKLDQQSQN